MVQAVRLISFSIDDGPARAGICDGELVRDTGLSMRELLACGARTVRPVAEHPRSGIRPLPAVPDPGKIMCIGRNYREHAAEQGAEAPEAPLVFAKYSSALITEGDAIRLPAISDSVDWEAELVAVVGRRCKDVPESDAWGVIAAYTVMNDVSARDLQRGDGQWTRAKSLDTFAPLSPELVTVDEIADPHALAIRCLVNDQLMQDSNTGAMIHRIPRLVAHLSAAFTLEPGDLIATGTPSGVGAFRDPPVFLQPGDVVRCEVEAVGHVENPVVAGSP
jgi:2-keto-4-pentenoate hydratase/2-oxohepta-3-ene-1,7-dioic acid hydratase in catechol pathway